MFAEFTDRHGRSSLTMLRARRTGRRAVVVKPRFAVWGGSLNLR